MIGHGTNFPQAIGGTRALPVGQRTMTIVLQDQTNPGDEARRGREVAPKTARRANSTKPDPRSVDSCDPVVLGFFAVDAS